MEIKNKVAWIHGGSSGMGAETAKKLVEMGAKVLISARGVKRGEALAKELGENCIFVKADSLNYKELQAAADVAVEKWGRLDMLLSAAGGGLPSEEEMDTAKPPVVDGLFSDDPEFIESINEDLERGYKVNVIGPFNTARIAGKYMAQNEPGYMGERGSIILIGSIASNKIWLYPNTETAAPMPPGFYGYSYGAAKAGLLGLNRDLAFRLGEFGIRVNLITPGFFKTALTAVVQPELWDIENPMQIFPKHGGNPVEVAHLAVAIFENVFMNRGVYSIDAGYIG